MVRRKQDNNEQQHLKYVHKFSGMDTGKEKKKPEVKILVDYC